MQDEVTRYPLQIRCLALYVSQSGYHAWRPRKPSRRAQENARLSRALQATHKRTRETYGPERRKPELRAQGFVVGLSRIKRLRKVLGLRCRQVRRFKATTDSAHDLPVAPNLLERRCVAKCPHEVWVTDLKHIASAEGFCISGP